jgi:hypothetical protein
VNIKAELYRVNLNKGWHIAFFLSLFLVFFLIVKTFNKNIIPGFQLGATAYNPYLGLLTQSLNILSAIVLPIIIAVVVFIQVKLTESNKTWLYGLTTQQPFYYIINKLASLFIIWFLFLLFLYGLILFLSLLLINIYPKYFIDYPIHHQFLLFWFLKYYLCSLGAVSILYLMNLLIKSKPVILTITILLPFIGVFFSKKGISFPLSYAYFSNFNYLVNYRKQLELNFGTNKAYHLASIVTGYEILSLIIVGACLFGIAYYQKDMIRNLIKP